MWDLSLLNDLLDAFNTASATWPQYLYPLALRTFFVLIAIETTWTAIRLLIQAEPSLARFFEALIRKVLYFGFVYFLLATAPSVLPQILSGFADAGQIAANGNAGGGLNPSAFLTLGVNSVIFLAARLNTLGLFTAPLSLFWWALGAILIMLAYVAMAAIMLLVLIEARILIGACFFLLAFAGTRWTYFLAEGALGAVFRTAIKLFTLNLVASLVYGLLSSWTNKLQAATSFSTADFLLYATSIAVVPFLIWGVPRIAHQILPGHVHFGLNPGALDN